MKALAINNLQGLTGEQAFWRIGPPVAHEALTKAWERAGLDPNLLPPQTTPERALTRAVKELEERHRLVRRLKSNAWLVVDERPDGPGMRYDSDLTVSLSGDRPKLAPDYHARRDDIFRAFEQALLELTGGDISAWLTKLMTHVAAVPLRETGGVYFIPRHTAQLWTRMRDVATALGHKVYRIPMVTDDHDAIEAITDAIMAETDAVADQVEADIVDGAGPRAIQTRFQVCEATEAKVAVYEELLGGRLDSLRGRLERLRANLAAAAFHAAGQQQQEASR